jgi:hypothetical protein
MQPKLYFACVYIVCVTVPKFSRNPICTSSSETGMTGCFHVKHVVDRN